MTEPSYDEIVKHYSSPTVRREILKIAKNREVVGTTVDNRYMKRPDALLYPKDLLQRIKDGAITFHCSVERWSNPMALSSDLKPGELDELRNGWDLIIDIDAKNKLEHARVAAFVIVDFLKEIGVTPTVKFSGRRGFHIAVAHEAFPREVNFSFLSKRYPSVPRTLVAFIKEKIKDRVLTALIEEEGGVSALMKDSGTKEPDPYFFVDIEQNWGNRHLFRMPYALHPKTWKVSIPIRLFKLKSFVPEKAEIGSVTPAPFLVNKKEEATELLLQALDWSAKNEKKKVTKEVKKIRQLKAPIPEQFFPPCIKTLIGGVKDGKKRSIFTLITFLKSVNWKWENVEEKIWEWNANNEKLGEGLSNRFVISQLRWHERQNRDILPANCDSQMFYHNANPKLCDDKNCGGIKNPVNYAFRHYLRDRFQKKQRHKTVRRDNKRQVNK